MNYYGMQSLWESNLLAFYFFKQLKEMVLALLNESDLCLSDDVVEQIVDKVRNSLFCQCHIATSYWQHHLTACDRIWLLMLLYIYRRSSRQIQKVMER